MSDNKKIYFLICLASLVLTACQPGESNVESGLRQGILHLGNGTEVQGVDPHVVTGVPEHHVIQAIFEGLVVKNPYTLEPEPASAERWEISEDGRVYRFYLREDANWSNGDPVTAHDYVWAWRRALIPEMGNLYSYMMYPVLNAEAFNTGKIDDFDQVGIKALADKVLEVTLNEPTPYFLQLLDHYSMFPLHPPTVEKFGGAESRFTPWTRTENIVTNGPFLLKEWKLYRHLYLEKWDGYYDADRVQLNGIYMYPTENVIAEERMYRVGAIHYANDLTYEKIEVYKESNSPDLKISDYLGTYYYLLNITEPALADVRVRRALAMTVDRESLTQNVFNGVNSPSYAIVPPNTLGYQPPKLFDFDPEGARALLAEAGYPNGEGFPDVEILYNTHESHRQIAIAIQQMWKEHLNIDVTIVNQEWKVYIDNTTEMNYQIARRGWIGDYVDPNNFLDMFLTDGGNNRTGFAVPEYDDIILQQAPKTFSQEERFAKFYEAETMLMEAMPIIPIYTYQSKHLLHPSVKGMPSNIMDYRNYRYIYLQED